MAAHRLPDTLSSELCHGRPPARRWLALPHAHMLHADTGGHRPLRIATRAARRHAQQSTEARTAC
eukprot:7118966-Prymnesium_polylepis.1